jgi:hypothetical protein
VLWPCSTASSGAADLVANGARIGWTARSCRDRDRDRERRGAAARAPWASVPGGGAGVGVGVDVDVYGETQMGKSRSMAFLAISDGRVMSTWGALGVERCSEAEAKAKGCVRPGQGQGQGQAAMQARGRTSKNNIDSERASRRADTSLIGAGRVEMGWRG